MHEFQNVLKPNDAAWLADTIARNRTTYTGFRMEADGGDGGGDGGGAGGDGGAGDKTLTQADVDKLVGKARIEERNKVSAKFADYDDLKAKADGAKTLEDRVAEIEQRAGKSEDRALRAEVANAKGLTPTQAKRLIGTTREELEVDADDLLKDFATSGAERKKGGNHVRGEGKTTTKATDDPLRDLTRELFGNNN